jgi:hypothetical protein
LSREEERKVTTSTQTLKEKAYHELREYVIITLYLWMVFAVFLIYKSVILSQHNISVVAHGVALINALALGKIMLIAQALNLGNRFDDGPLIYPTLFKSAMFALILASFKIVEERAIGYYHGKAFWESLADFGGGTVWGILAFTLIMWVILIPFVGVSELRRVLGPGAMERLFWHERAPEENARAA